MREFKGLSHMEEGKITFRIVGEYEFCLFTHGDTDETGVEAASIAVWITPEVMLCHGLDLSVVCWNLAAVFQQGGETICLINGGGPEDNTNGEPLKYKSPSEALVQLIDWGYGAAMMASFPAVDEVFAD